VTSAPCSLTHQVEVHMTLESPAVGSWEGGVDGVELHTTLDSPTVGSWEGGVNSIYSCRHYFERRLNPEPFTLHHESVTLNPSP